MEQIGCQVSERIQKRVIIFSSGCEIKKGLIQDTNSPYIKSSLVQEGYRVTIGQVLEDNQGFIVSTLSKAVNEGFGLIITTGGVGVEDKDRTIEALLELDPMASTPYIIRYEKGTGRHEKDGVKIGGAYVKPSFIIPLPGPHEEVKVGLEVIIDGLKRRLDKEKLATALSERYVGVLREIHR